MKVQIVKRDEHFFVRSKGFFGFHRYLDSNLLWWSLNFNPDERYYGFPSLEKAKADLNRYVEEERAHKKSLEKEKLRRRLRRTPMFIVEEFVIDV